MSSSGNMRITEPFCLSPTEQRQFLCTVAYVQYKVGGLLITNKLITYKLITYKLITKTYKLIADKLLTSDGHRFLTK